MASSAACGVRAGGGGDVARQAQVACSQKALALPATPARSTRPLEAGITKGSIGLRKTTSRKPLHVRCQGHAHAKVHDMGSLLLHERQSIIAADNDRVSRTARRRY
eukprot:COSAG03_NODE_5890_length_1155_cov_1.883523_2_plen_106_part_00